MAKIISDRCLIRPEPEGSCNGKFMQNHQQFKIVQKIKTYTEASWFGVKDIKTEGLYLHKAKGELAGNSTMTFITCIGNTWYFNVGKKNFDVHRTQKLDCNANKDSLFFGPIPTPKE